MTSESSARLDCYKSWDSWEHAESQCVTRKMRKMATENRGVIHIEKICKQGIPHSSFIRVRMRNPLFADFLSILNAPGFFIAILTDFTCYT
jgi:hypothetical protein